MSLYLVLTEGDQRERVQNGDIPRHWVFYSMPVSAAPDSCGPSRAFGDWVAHLQSLWRHWLFPLCWLAPVEVSSLGEGALGPHLQYYELCQKDNLRCTHACSPGAPCPAWNPVPAASLSSAPPPPLPPLASPTVAQWCPDSWLGTCWQPVSIWHQAVLRMRTKSI